MAEKPLYCNSFASASGNHENNTKAFSCKALKQCFTLKDDQITD
jgi:hypothetical protein